MIRFLALLAGAGLIAMGFMAGMPKHLINGDFLGYFEVSNIYNVAYMGAGILGVLAAISYGVSKLYFQLFGILFALAAAFGFILSGNLVFLHVNMADNIFNLVVAIVFLFLGFIASHNHHSL